MNRRRFLVAATAPPTLLASRIGTAAPISPTEASFANVRDAPFGAKGDGRSDDTQAIQRAIDTAQSGSVLFPPGTYRCHNLRVDSANLVGSGMLATVLVAIGEGPIMNLGFVEPHWAYRGIQGMTLDGRDGAADGVRFASRNRTEISGRWTFERVQFLNCERGVLKPSGNIGNAFVNCLFRGCRFGYYAVSNDDPIMHTGNDTFDMCHLEGNSGAAIYTDCNVPGGGALKLRDSIVENNPGFGVFLNNFTGQYAPVVLDNVWMESNAFAESVVVDGVARRPCDAFVRNTSRITIVNGRLEKLELVNSHALVQSAYIVYPGSIKVDPESSIMYDFPHLEYGVARFGVVQRGPVGAQNQSGRDAPVFRLNPRWILSFEADGASAVSASFADSNSYPLRGRKQLRARRVADGLLFDACAQLDLPAGAVAIFPQTRARMRAGGWALLTVDLKLMKPATDLAIRLIGDMEVTSDVASMLRVGEWVSIGSISRIAEDGYCAMQLANSSDRAVALRFSAFQLLQFDRLQKAIDYLNSGQFLIGTGHQREASSDRAPTSGTWRVGDRIWNTTPKAAGIVGWVCIASGSPGQWKPFGRIEA